MVKKRWLSLTVEDGLYFHNWTPLIGNVHLWALGPIEISFKLRYLANQIFILSGRTYLPDKCSSNEIVSPNKHVVYCKYFGRNSRVPGKRFHSRLH